MLKLVNRSIISDFSFDFVADVEIKSSLDELTDTATVIIPRKLNYRRNGVLLNNIVSGDNPVFKRGDPVELQAGYDDRINQVFKGYISDIVPRLPLKFSVQDRMYLLKQHKVGPYTVETVTLKKLLTDILPPDVKFEALDVQLGWFRIRVTTAAKVLEHLQTHYGLTCNFRNDVLYCGLRYINTDLVNSMGMINPDYHLPVFRNGVNIADDTNLVFKRSDEQPIKLTAISINTKNEKIKVEVGDSFGEQRTMYFYNLDAASLKKIAEENIDKLKYTGFFGSFDTFLEPQIKKGDAIKLGDPQFEEKDGVYLVKAVHTSYGAKGSGPAGRQTIFVDKKVA